MDRLPLEVIAQIVSKLGIEDKKTCRLVAPHFQFLIDELFLLFNPVLNNTNYRAFKTSTLKFSKLRIQEFDVEDSDLQGTSTRSKYANNFTAIEIDSPSAPRHAQRLFHNARQLVYLNRKVKFLKIFRSFWTSYRSGFLPFTFSMDNLQELHISFNFATKLMTCFEGFHAPLVRTLTLFHNNEFSCSFTNYIDVYKFVLFWRKSLTNLCVFHEVCLSRTRALVLPTTENQDEILLLKSNLKNMSLSNITCGLHPFEDFYSGIALSMMKHQSCLKEFKISGERLFGKTEVLASIIGNNSTTLEIISIQGTEQAEEISHVLRVLRLCKFLRELRLDMIKITEFFELPITLQKLPLTGHVETDFGYELKGLNELEEFIFADYPIIYQEVSDNLINNIPRLPKISKIYWHKLTMPAVTLDVLYRNKSVRSIQIKRIELGCGLKLRTEFFYFVERHPDII